MFYEIESKYLLKCSVESFLDKIKDLHPEKYVNIVETDIYFDHPCWSFPERDEALRVRVMNLDGVRKIILTFKGRRITGEEFKVREEISVEVNNVDSITQMLNKLGFKQLASFSKRRLLIHLGRVDISLDELIGVGFYVEIEGLKDEIKKIYAYLSECLEPVDKTYLEICLETSKCGVIHDW